MIKRFGDRLILIGSAHVLSDSSRQVKEVILRERPERVGVELCPSRYLTLTGKGLETGQPKIRGLRDIFTFLLYQIQLRFAKSIGSAPGEDMLAAIEGAREVEAGVELLDRDITLTVSRWLASMSFREKMRMVAEMLISFLPWGTKLDLSRVTDEATVKPLLDCLRRTAPATYRVLIDERDAYISSKIKRLLASTSGKIICVVGAGHVPGISERLKDVEEMSSWGKFEFSW